MSSSSFDFLTYFLPDFFSEYISVYVHPCDKCRDNFSFRLIYGIFNILCLFLFLIWIILFLTSKPCELHGHP